MIQTARLVSPTSTKADSNVPLRSLVITLLNSTEPLFPVLHLLFILSPSDMNGLPPAAQREKKVFCVRNDEEIIFMKLGESKIST
jgi:hypothetical protein